MKYKVVLTDRETGDRQEIFVEANSPAAVVDSFDANKYAVIVLADEPKAANKKEFTILSDNPGLNGIGIVAGILLAMVAVIFAVDSGVSMGAAISFLGVGIFSFLVIYFLSKIANRPNSQQ